MHYQEGVEGVKGMKSVSYQDVLQEKDFEQEVENTNTLNFFNTSTIKHIFHLIIHYTTGKYCSKIE